MAKHDIEIVSYSDVSQDAPAQKVGTFIVALIIVLVLISASLYYIFKEIEDDDPEIEELEAVIDLGDIGSMGISGPEFNVWQGEEFVLKANGSLGEISSYEWDMDGDIDSDHDGIAINDADVTGETITHTYTRLGQYTIRLWVYDASGGSDRVQSKVRVSYREEDISSSTSSPTNTRYEKTFLVPSSTEANTEVQNMRVNISYNIGSSPQNSLNLSIFDGMGNYVLNGTYSFTQGVSKTIGWELDAQWLASYAPGTWTIMITQETPIAQPRTITFSMDVFVIY